MLEKFAQIEIKKIFFLALFVGVGYYFNFYNEIEPLELRIIQLTQEIKKESELKVDSEKTLLEQNRMKASIMKLNDQYQTISRRLPPNLTSFDINKMIDATIKRSGGTLKNKRPVGNVKSEMFEEVPIDVEVVGQFSEIAQFVNFISSNERLSRVKNISLNKDEKNNEIILKGTVVGYKLLGETQK